MSLRNLILQLLQIAIFFAFPAIWNFILVNLPWWPLDPQTTLGIVTGIIVAGVSWILALLKVRTVREAIKAKGIIK